MQVLLAGASGVLGTHMTKALVAAGHEVIAVSRKGQAGSLGGRALMADIMDRQALLTAVRGVKADAVIHAATALRKAPLRYRDMAATNALRVAGTANLVEAARSVGATRFVVETMVVGYGFGDWGDEWLTEAGTPFGPGGRKKGLDRIIEGVRSKEEQVFTAEGIEGVSLRYGFFYGEGFDVGGTDAIVTMLKQRKLPVTRGGGVLPWINLHDAGTAAVAALEFGRAGEAYNIVDDTPIGMSAYVRSVAEAFGTPKPRTAPMWMIRAMPYLHDLMKTSMWVSNAKAKRELGWRPEYATPHDGIAALASAETTPR